MREPLRPYRGANRVNYLCILAHEMMGVKSLRDLPQLLSGFESILQALHPDVAPAVFTLFLEGERRCDALDGSCSDCFHAC